MNRRVAAPRGPERDKAAPHQSRIRIAGVGNFGEIPRFA